MHPVDFSELQHQCISMKCYVPAKCKICRRWFKKKSEFPAPAYQRLQMETPYVGCNNEQSARHCYLLSALLSLHVYWLGFTFVRTRWISLGVAEAEGSVATSAQWKVGGLLRFKFPPRSSSAAVSGASLTFPGLIALGFVFSPVSSWQNAKHRTDDLEFSLTFLTVHQSPAAFPVSLFGITDQACRSQLADV